MADSSIKQIAEFVDWTDNARAIQSESDIIIRVLSNRNHLIGGNISGKRRVDLGPLQSQPRWKPRFANEMSEVRPNGSIGPTSAVTNKVGAIESAYWQPT